MEEEIEWGYILFTEEERKKIDRMLAEVEEERDDPSKWYTQEQIEEMTNRYIEELTNGHKVH